MRILIAEDEEFFRLPLELALRQGEDEVVVCADGTAAWEILQADPAIGLAILDWMMPGLEGPEICRRATNLRRFPPPYLILLTGKNQRADIVAGLEAGADDYVTKPFDLDELRARIAVGRRVVALQEKLLAAERVQVLAQTAGAAAHEVNQPLSVLMAQAQMLTLKVPPDFPELARIEAIIAAARRIAEIVRRMGAARQYVTKPYVEGVEIVDLDAASRSAGPSAPH